jgi:hypothetical protein
MTVLRKSSDKLLDLAHLWLAVYEMVARWFRDLTFVARWFRDLTFVARWFGDLTFALACCWQLLGEDSSDIDIALYKMTGQEFCQRVNNYFKPEKPKRVGVSKRYAVFVTPIVLIGSRSAVTANIMPSCIMKL